MIEIAIDKRLKDIDSEGTWLKVNDNIIDIYIKSCYIYCEPTYGDHILIIKLIDSKYGITNSDNVISLKESALEYYIEYDILNGDRIIKINLKDIMIDNYNPTFFNRVFGDLELLEYGKRILRTYIENPSHIFLNYIGELQYEVDSNYNILYSKKKLEYNKKLLEKMI